MSRGGWRHSTAAEKSGRSSRYRSQGECEGWRVQGPLSLRQAQGREEWGRGEGRKGTPSRKPQEGSESV